MCATGVGGRCLSDGVCNKHKASLSTPSYPLQRQQQQGGLFLADGVGALTP